MARIYSKKAVSFKSLLNQMLSRSCEMPDDSFIRDFGIATVKAGHECDLHYHDCDEWWVIVSGRAKIICGNIKKEASGGDMVFTKAGEKHHIKAIEDTTLVWLQGPLVGEKRNGHLH